MRDIEIDQREIISKTPVWSDQPSEMILRFWPNSWTGGNTFNSSFRYRLGGQRQEHNVRFERWRREVPLTPAQYTFWDRLRTEIVLLPKSDEWHLWTGMTTMPASMDRPIDQRWDQSHIFFAIRNTTKSRWEQVYDHHFNTIGYEGRWQENQQYLDWIMNSRKPIIW